MVRLIFVSFKLVFLSLAVCSELSSVDIWKIMFMCSPVIRTLEQLEPEDVQLGHRHCLTERLYFALFFRAVLTCSSAAGDVRSADMFRSRVPFHHYLRITSVLARNVNVSPASWGFLQGSPAESRWVTRMNENCFFLTVRWGVDAYRGWCSLIEVGIIFNNIHYLLNTLRLPPFGWRCARSLYQLVCNLLVKKKVSPTLTKEKGAQRHVNKLQFPAAAH